MLGVEVGVIVGSSKLTRVSAGTDVGVGLLDVGVSSRGARVDMDTGVSVVWEAGRLQDDTPMSAAMAAIHRRFLMLSSFSQRMVLAG
jgi:hypothetical protein